MLRSLRTSRFRRLYRDELEFVWTVLRRLGVDDAQVEDAAHDVFVVVHRRLDDFEGRSADRTWLYAIARRIAWRYRRADRRRERRRAALADEPRRPREPSPEDSVSRTEAAELLQAFLEGLDRPKREAFVLGEIERLPRSSLGRALGVSPGTAYSRLRAARADFAATFGRSGEPGGMVRRVARSREAPPRAARARMWLALPGGLLGRAAGLELVVGMSVATMAVGAVVLHAEPVVKPAPERASAPAALRRGGGRGPSSPAPDRSDRSVRSDRPVSSAELARDESVGDAVTHSASVGQARAMGGSDRPTRERSTSARPSTGPAEGSPLAAGARAVDVASPLAAPIGVDPSPGIEAPPTSEALIREARLLAEARAAMRAGDWSSAWQRLEAHARRFPAGELIAEREVSAVIVACRLGRVTEARARARARLRGTGDPALRAVLRDTCVADLLPTSPRTVGSNSSISSSEVGDQGQ